jgi:hypothetical protein
MESAGRQRHLGGGVGIGGGAAGHDRQCRNGTDTDYMSMGVKVRGTPASVITQFVGAGGVINVM